MFRRPGTDAGDLGRVVYSCDVLVPTAVLCSSVLRITDLGIGKEIRSKRSQNYVGR